MKSEEFAGVDQAEVFKQRSTAQILGAQTDIAIRSYVDEFGLLDPERGLDLLQPIDDYSRIVLTQAGVARISLAREYVVHMQVLAERDDARIDETPRDHFSIRGSILVDQRSWSPTSLSVTVMTSLAPSIATWPKNCNPKLGARSSRCAPLHPFWKTARGPKVLSSVCGRQVPAWRGPEMNSQNGSKSWNTAALGS